MKTSNLMLMAVSAITFLYATAHAAPDAAAQAAAVPLQTYASYAATEMNYTLALQKDGKALLVWTVDGEVAKQSGSWKQDGNKVTVSLPDRKRKSTDKYVFEYRSELKSSEDSYAGCTKFPEGLLPIDLNKGPYSKEEMLMFYAWPENQVRSKNGPCLVQG